MGVTLRDVAARAGVSPSTACRALADHAHIHPATRARVLAAAQELNYVPNRLARSLVRRRSELLGFILFDVAHSYFAPVSRGIEEAAHGAGYDVVYACTERDQQTERNAVDLMLRLRADGCLLTPVLDDISHLERARQAGMRIVCLGTAPADSGFPLVAVDEQAAGRLATQHLLDLGHDPIGFVLSGIAGCTQERQRLEGYRQALESAGKKANEAWVVCAGEGDIAGGRAAGEQLLAMEYPPRAVVAGDDLLAIGLAARWREAGRNVPGDLAIVGFNDSEVGACLEVPLTSVAMPRYEIGRRAAEMMLDLLGNGSEGEHLLLEPRLVVRQSCGA